MKFEIPLPPITKKNHQRILRHGSVPFIAPSKEYIQYEETAGWYVPREHMNDGPYNVKAEFYMPTRRRCDLVNLLEALDDVLVKAGFLEDDDFHHIGGHDGSRVLYDKQNPRTVVTVTTMDVEEDES